MTKIVKIKSKKSYLYDTPEHIMLCTYAYKPASVAVQAFTTAVLQFNENVDQKLAIKIVPKWSDAEQATIKLIGKSKSIDTFINRLIAETCILQYFDIRL